MRETEDYIAKTTGARNFPWRIFAIAEKDADLITNLQTMDYALLEPKIVPVCEIFILLSARAVP